MDLLGPSQQTPTSLVRPDLGESLERHLMEDNHRVWGFVIYRSTYDSDADWDKLITSIRDQVHFDLKHCSDVDMIDNFELTVFEDRERFDNAPTAVIREHFRQWIATAAPQEQDGAAAGLSQRYRYCIQVGQDALHSVVQNTVSAEDSDDDLGEISFLRLLLGDWAAREFEHVDDELEDEEPIEGCRQWDVGWMEVEFGHLLFDMYIYLRREDGWDIQYRRPPVTALV